MRSFEKNLRLFYAHSKKGRGNMLTRIFGAVTGGRLNLRAAASSSAAIIASIPNETLLILSEHNDMEYRVLPHGGEKNQRHRHGRVGYRRKA